MGQKSFKCFAVQISALFSHLIFLPFILLTYPFTGMNKLILYNLIAM